MAKNKRQISDAEIDSILDTWTPDPLVPDHPQETFGLQQSEINKIWNAFHPPIITSRPDKYTIINGKKCLNIVCHDYLGLSDHQQIEKGALTALRRYGVGSCGPRGFYGTIDVHLSLEKELAEFMGTEEAILYSFGFTTMASAISPYAKPSDVIFVDEQCNFALKQGLVASRAKVKKFRHNDMDHLASLLEEQENFETRECNRDKAMLIRRFLIVEGLYLKTGLICPLSKLIELKRRYKVRLFIDESCSIGVLGKNGRGVSDHFNVDIGDIDMIMASLENAFCSYGGFCTGTKYIINHQRLSGLGYCFSASLPPLQTQAAREALKLIRGPEGRKLRQSGWDKFTYAHKKLEENLATIGSLKCVSNPQSPIKHLILQKKETNANVRLQHINVDSSSDDDSVIEPMGQLIVFNGSQLEFGRDLLDLTNISKLMVDNFSTAITVTQAIHDQELTTNWPSIRLTLRENLEYHEIDNIVENLGSLAKDLLSRHVRPN